MVVDMTEITVSTRLEPEIRAKLIDKALSDGLDICKCLKMLVYGYLGLKTDSPLGENQRLDFGLQIGDYKKKNCKHNVKGVCEYWSWKKEDIPENPPVKFVEYEGIFGEKRFNSEAIRERCAFCYAYERRKEEAKSKEDSSIPPFVRTEEDEIDLEIEDEDEIEIED